MSGAVLHLDQPGTLMFRCPGCRSSHVVSVGAGDGPRWEFNGDMERPTFKPSILVRGVRENLTEEERRQYKDEYARVGLAAMDGKFGGRCHSYVTDGFIQFLGDCSHDLKGQTVPLPAWDRNNQS